MTQYFKNSRVLSISAFNQFFSNSVFFSTCAKIWHQSSNIPQFSLGEIPIISEPSDLYAFKHVGTLRASDSQSFARARYVTALLCRPVLWIGARGTSQTSDGLLGSSDHVVERIIHAERASIVATSAFVLGVYAFSTSSVVRTTIIVIILKDDDKPDIRRW